MMKELVEQCCFFLLFHFFLYFIWIFFFVTIWYVNNDKTSKIPSPKYPEIGHTS